MPGLVQNRVGASWVNRIGMRASLAAIVLLFAFSLVPAEARTIGDCRIRPGALCVEARLSGADLSGENLARAGFFMADLRAANLSRANLRNANLKEANLSGPI